MGKAGGIAIARNTIFIKNGTYTISTASTNVSGGTLDTTVAGGMVVIGYQTTRTAANTGTRPILQVAAALSNCRIFKGSATTGVNLELDGNLQTNSSVADATAVNFFRCIFRNFTADNASAGRIVGCLATGNSAAQFAGGVINYACEAYGNTATHGCFPLVRPCVLTSKRIRGNVPFFNCVAYGNGGDGFDVSDSRMVVNSYAEGNTGYGFRLNNIGPNVLFIGTGGFNNTLGLYSNSTFSAVGNVTPTTSVFTSAAGNDFSLNNTATGGALLRALGYPLTTFPRGTTATQMDIGASQVVPTGGSGGGSAVYAMQQRIKQLIAGERLLDNIAVIVK